MNKRYKSFTLFNYHEIPQISALTAGQKETIEIVGKVLPFKTNSYVINELINWDNIPDDPIYTLTFPRKEMLAEEHFNKVKSLIDSNASPEILKETINNIRLSLNPNPAGQAHNVPEFEGEKLQGIQHKYRETVLFFPSQGQTCHAYCTFCFRWPQFSNMEGLKFAMKETDLLFRYLKSKPEVTDLLITGGDPLTMSTQILKQYIEPLLNNKDLEHIRTIRIGTKSLAYWPYRFLTDTDSAELLSFFEQVVKSLNRLPTEIMQSAC